MSDVKRNLNIPGILPTSNALELLKRRAEEHMEKTRKPSLNILAHQLYDQCKGIEALCAQLLQLAEEKQEQPKQDSDPAITHEQLEQYLHILAAKYDFDPGPKEVARCLKLVSTYPASAVFAAFKDLHGSSVAGRLSTEDFVYSVQRAAREQRAIA